MKIELKNVELNNGLSEETTAFYGEVYINGKKALYARNDGRGGCTDYNRFEGHLETMKKAEAYCLTLPPKVYSATKHYPEFSVDMNLEQMIDSLLDDFIAMKDVKKNQNKGVVYGHLGGEIYRRGYNQSIAKLKNTPRGQMILKNLIANIKANLTEGQKILNTNLKGFL